VWFDGAQDVRAALAAHVLTGPWRCTPTVANGAPALVCSQEPGDATLVVLDVRDGRVARLTAFSDVAALSGLRLPRR
jgi:hypothetical protein